MTTKSIKLSEIQRKWHLIDLDGQTLGRVSTRISQLLIGKNKTNYTPNIDNGDFVVAINAKNIKVTGKKSQDKTYYHHTFFPGGLRKYTYAQLMEKDPAKIITRAVKNMLPKNKLRKNRLARFKVFAEKDHKYQAQINVKPKTK